MLFHTHTLVGLSWAWTGADPFRAGTITSSSLQMLPASSGRSGSTGLYSSLRGINYRMVKTQLPQPGCGQELEEEENLALWNQQHQGGISQGQSHSCVFAVTRGALIISQLSKEEKIGYPPCGWSFYSLCQQVYSQSSILKLWEHRRKWLCKCSRLNLQHGRGWEEADFWGQSSITVMLKEDKWGLGASEMLL